MCLANFLGRERAMSSTPTNRIGPQSSPDDSSAGPALPKNLSRPPSRSWLTALLRQRCPDCRQGSLFKNLFIINSRCPVCGLRFEREPGYYVGAMYFSYALALAILVPLFFLFQWLLPDWPTLLIPLLPVLIYLPFTPVVYRYSRALWIYFDRFGGGRKLSPPR
jgi:uncharacterized protein (DUF983 family)